MDHKNNRFIKIKKGMGKSFLMIGVCNDILL